MKTPESPSFSIRQAVHGWLALRSGGRVLLWVEFILRRPRHFRTGWKGIRRQFDDLFKSPGRRTK